VINWNTCISIIVIYAQKEKAIFLNFSYRSLGIEIDHSILFSSAKYEIDPNQKYLQQIIIMSEIITSQTQRSGESG